MDVALFPLFATAEHLLELDGIGDVTEAESDRSHLHYIDECISVAL